MSLIKFNFTILMFFFFVNILTFHYYNLFGSIKLVSKENGCKSQVEHKEEVNKSHQKQKTEGNVLPEKFHD